MVCLPLLSCLTENQNGSIVPDSVFPAVMSWVCLGHTGGRGQADSEKPPLSFSLLLLLFPLQSIASADMDLNQLEAFLTAQTKKQGGITSDQAAVIAKFWKNHRIKIHESLINQSRWDNVLKNMNWRVDLKSQSRNIDQINTPVAIVEMELGKNGYICAERFYLLLNSLHPNQVSVFFTTGILMQNA
uniref:COMM domain-containing protein 1 n=1 Tax=Accipiter nisus TaxID=211598 RepID=A0A8B9MZR6_9AVES